MMKKVLSNLFAKLAMVAVLATAFAGSAWAEAVTLVSGSGSGSSDYAVPDGWTSSGTVAGGSYLKLEEGTITSPEFAPHNGLSFTYTVATFGSGTNHPLTIRILNASTNAVIVEKTTATPTSSSYISTNSPLSLGDISVNFKIQLYAPSGKGIRLRNYSVTGTPAGNSNLTASNLAITGAPVALSFDLYNNKTAQTVSYTTSGTGAVTVSGGTGYITTSVNSGNKTITVTPVAVTPSAQTITINQAADDTYAAGSATFTVSIADSTPVNGAIFDATKDTGAGSISKNGVSFVCTNGVLDNGSEYRLYKNSTTTFSVTDGVIKEIAFTGVSGNPASGFGTQSGWTTDGNNGTWVGSSKSVSFVASGAQVRASKIVVTVDLNGAEDPSISADNVNIEYSATGGSIAFTVANPVNGGSISASTEANWLTLGSETASPISFTCDANSENTARSATVTLTYTYDSNKTVTKNVTVTQTAAPVIYSTIPALFAAATSSEKSVNVTFDSWVVSGVSTNGRNIYVTDNSGNGFIIYYTSDMSGTYHAGDIISGTNVSCNLVLYNGAAEIKNLDASDLTISSGGTVSVSNIAMDSLAGINSGALVSYSNLTCSISNNKYYLSDGTTTLQLYNQLFAFGALTAGKEYIITGVYLQYNSTKEIMPRSAADIQEIVPIVPTITPATTSINVDAAGGDGTIDVIYDNITTVVAEVAFYEADGTTSATYDWIDADINSSNNIEYLVDENTNTVSRTAYMKVWAYDDDTNEVYSELITITQAGFVADYATLPFAYDGDGTGNLPAGFTVSGLGKYNSSPAMKFDGTGDYAILKINETPGTLTFDIKGNSFSGGTFKVQTSADGETFTDLKTYTTLGDLQSEEFSLESNVRCIKWIYVEKETGNVALGNIKLTKLSGADSYTRTGVLYNGMYWTSFFCSTDGYTLSEGAKAFTMNASHQLYQLGEGNVIPADTAVIIISQNETITLTKNANASASISGSENILVGYDSAKAVSSVTGTPYVLGIVGGELGFYKYTGTNIPAMKAYYTE